MYCNGQTLVHKEKGFLARLATRDDGPWAWDIGENTAMVLEDGIKAAYDINEFTHIEDEWGNPYANAPRKGQFVDESAKKYLVSKEKLADMRKPKLAQFKEWGELFMPKLLQAVMGKLKPNIVKTKRCIEYKPAFQLGTVHQENYSISGHSEKPKKGDCQFFVPRNRYFNFYTEVFIPYLVKRGWKVQVMEKKSGWSNHKFIATIFATKGKETLFWNHMNDSSLSLVEVTNF